MYNLEILLYIGQEKVANGNYICGVNANGVRYSAREDEQLEKERCYLFKVLFCCDSELQSCLHLVWEPS